MIHGLVSALQLAHRQPASFVHCGVCVTSRQTGNGLAPFLKAALVLSLTLSQSALAQQSNALTVKVGEADLTPAVRLDYVSNSNAFLMPDNEVDATGLIVSPEVLLRAERRLLTLELGYTGEFAAYSEDILNYDDHRLVARLNSELSSRQRVIASLEIVDDHDDTGTGLTRVDGSANDEQVEFVNVLLNAQYIFGASAARGNLIAGLFVSNETFQNRSDITAGNDFTQIAPFGRFSYRLSSDTRLFSELRFRRFDFDNSARDRSDVVTSLGLSFSGTGSTRGEAILGITQVDFDASVRENETFVSADINLFYNPSTISSFVLRISRELNNADITGGAGLTSDAIDDDLSLTWAYDWSGFVTTRASLGAEIVNRDCDGFGTQTTTAGFELGLKPRRWLEFGAGVQSSRRTDDNCIAVDGAPIELDYTRQLINVFVRATL